MRELLIIACLFTAYNCGNVPMSTDPPKGPNGTALDPETIPQFVMLTYDDAITITNYNATYQHLFNLTNKANGCPIRATFFVSHENTNYQLVNDMWTRGHEIASHTITHKSPADYWKVATPETLKAEIVGQRDIIVKFASINETSIKGYRAPFLQTSGEGTFKFLADNKFLYDSSMPTQSNSKPWPIFPYTLENGFRQDCVIEPCPKDTDKHPGFWEVPIVDYWRKRVVIEGQPPVDSPCSMVDFCLPAPNSTQDAEDYFMSNFNRHHKNNRAPFPVFIHETWLSQDEPNRKAGYFNFIKKLLQMEEVFFVTIQEVLEWMENPVPLAQYKEQHKVCKQKLKTKCLFDLKDTSTHKFCKPIKGDDSQEHLMPVCDICANHYPRLGHTSGDD